MKAAHLVEHPKKVNEKKPVIQETKFIDILSKVATVVAILMYVSYISQIKNNGSMIFGKDKMNSYLYRFLLLAVPLI